MQDFNAKLAQHGLTLPLAIACDVPGVPRWEQRGDRGSRARTDDGAGVTHGELVSGVRYSARGAYTETLAMRSRSGTMRRIQSHHNFSKLSRYTAVAYE